MAIKIYFKMPSNITKEFWNVITWMKDLNSNMEINFLNAVILLIRKWRNLHGSYKNIKFIKLVYYWIITYSNIILFIYINISFQIFITCRYIICYRYLKIIFRYLLKISSNNLWTEIVFLHYNCDILWISEMYERSILSLWKIS